MSKRYYFAISCLFAALMFFAECRNVQVVQNDIEPRYTISPLDYPLIEPGAAEAVIADVRVVDLEFTQAALMRNIVKVLTLDNGDFIVTDKEKICHFSGGGKHIRNYGMEGRGPQEYITIGDMCVDDRGNLIVMDPTNKILFYSVETGSFIKSFTLNWSGNVKRSDAIVPGSDGGFFIVSANTSRREPGDEFYCLTQFDSTGKKISELLPTDDFVYMNSLVSHSDGGRYIIKPVDNQNIAWEVNHGLIEPLCVIDFGSMNVESGAAFMPDGQMSFPRLIETNSYKMPHCFQDTEGHISLLVAGPRGQSSSYIYSKDRNDGFAIAAPDKMMMPIKFLGSDRDYFYMVMDKSSMEGMDEYADPVTRYIMEQYGVLGETDNQRLVGIRFK